MAILDTPWPSIILGTNPPPILAGHPLNISKVNLPLFNSRSANPRLTLLSPSCLEVRFFPLQLVLFSLFF